MTDDRPDRPTYLLAEKFFALQGEGAYAGTPMAFFRFVGCSVGKKTCHACDTDFDRVYPWLGGGIHTVEDLRTYTYTNFARHVCLTGGEPLDQNLEPFAEGFHSFYERVHIETSGTRPIPEYLRPLNPWICVSPKPGFLEAVVQDRHVREVKVIVGGLGSGDGWPTLDDAKRWASMGKEVFLQPRNQRFAIDRHALARAKELVMENPELRLSVQLHKVLEHR